MPETFLEVSVAGDKRGTGDQFLPHRLTEQIKLQRLM
jgi:hypothetical protein